MKCLLIAAVALLLFAFASPVQALTQDEAQHMAASVGCPIPVEMWESSTTPFNAFYDPGGYSGNERIVLINFDSIPESWQRFIVWHELGHCMQFHEGRYATLQAAGVSEVEWDADRFAINQLASEGVDGAAISQEMLEYIWRTYGVDGDKDEPHGLIVERIVRGNLNRVTSRTEAA